MFQSHVPLCLWGECIATAAFLINRTPSPNLENQSPYQRLYNTEPYYQPFKVFGCLCYAAYPSPNKTKFTPRAIPAVFMGYPIRYKGFKLYNIQSRTFMISRDVTFHETIFPFSITPPVDSPLELFPDLAIPKPAHDIPITPPVLVTDSTLLQTHEPPIRRSNRLSRPPSYLHEFICYCNI
ncbi:hypothetical protein L6164_013550 [Bauhinia variegata]|uniref:Uncharacterized protein n=1 Tax=Bauhinia variegata TaxID=167791 RepID=A0ACB9NFS1_BAUVA|nr:hypothetical protein L6164_013550 [Bauhinia variegata]